jgi:hypothetical protein
VTKINCFSHIAPTKKSYIPKIQKMEISKKQNYTWGPMPCPRGVEALDPLGSQYLHRINP